MVLSTQGHTVWQGDTIYVFGSRDKAFLAPGAARFISNDEIQKFNYSDPMRLLQTVPGTHLQEEDGLGLRPNIGLRGATPHRSKKITLMEDGIPVAPAPYSAPAAYFFPNMMKTNNVEIYKGTSSVKYGPNSVGGAINFVTRPIPSKRQTEIMASYGLVKKYRLSTGGTSKKFGHLFEYNRMESSGIKTLPHGKPTGFEKNDFTFKANYQFKKYGQKISLKTSHAYEKSHETYLGLTPQDFNRSPYARYAASSNDLMKWRHQQYQIRYAIKPEQNWKINTSLYYHKFTRNWSKFNGFNNGVHVSHYLNSASPLFDPHFLRIIRGTSDSFLDNGEDQIIIGNNNRMYYSGGARIQTTVSWQPFEDVHHDVIVGLGYHQDRIKRLHTKDTFKMKSSHLIPSLKGIPGTQNIDTSHAKTFFLENQMSFPTGLIISLGSRYEDIHAQRKFLNGKTPQKNSQYTTFVPGVGIQYSLITGLNLFTGISKGVSAVSPGQSRTAKPEESINYEAGAKYQKIIRGEIIGFFNDYKNIKGFCSYSTGCDEEDLEREFNGGKAHIYGLEGHIGKEFYFTYFDVPVDINYTKTITQFRKQSHSFNREWGIGIIRKGDPLPYIPEDKISLSVGMITNKFSSFLNYNWQGHVHDQTVREGRQIVPARTVIDWSAKYQYSKNSEMFFKIDNLLGEKHIVSMRPFGARPGKPRSFNLGLKYVF